jgi:hypothetical protein
MEKAPTRGGLFAKRESLVAVLKPSLLSKIGVSQNKSIDTILKRLKVATNLYGYMEKSWFFNIYGG